jgi:hypothetical protein
MTRGALYAQAIRGPLVLITVGALFAIHQAGVISFARTWPLIIIVIGLAKLVERLLMQPGYPAGPYPPGAAYQPGAPYSQGANYPPQPPPPPSGAPRV